MYRLLAERGEVRERRNQPTHPAYAKPELLAQEPNEVWSWDITKLKGPAKWTYFYLYAILDVFSRYVVGWTVQHRESAQIAGALISQAAEQQKIPPGRLTVHADRGSSMTSNRWPSSWPISVSPRPTPVPTPQPTTPTRRLTSRRSSTVRNSQPASSRSKKPAASCCEFFDWYNHQHRHSGIGLMTPDVVHHGRAEEVKARRTVVLTQAYLRTPERFVGGHPQPPALPVAAWINQPKEATAP